MEVSASETWGVVGKPGGWGSWLQKTITSIRKLE